MIIKNKEKENPSACSIFIIVNWDLNNNNYYVEMKKKNIMNMFVYRLNYCNHKIYQIQYNIELLQN